MWLEYIRYRFRIDKTDDLLELTQVAALKGLRHSPRCRGWRVLPAADDPSLLLLEIEWDPGADLTPFRGSQEFATIVAALALQARSLEEADYSVDDRLLRRALGGPDTLFQLTEDIVVGVLADHALARRFQSEDGSRRGRLGLWLLEVLGGPDLFSSSFPGSNTREGPLADDRLDLEERERLLEIAKSALPYALEEKGRCVVGNLRAHLPLHPAPRSVLTRLLKAAVSPRAISPAAVSPKAGSPKAVSPKAGSPKAVSPKAGSPKAVSPGADGDSKSAPTDARNSAAWPPPKRSTPAAPFAAPPRPRQAPVPAADDDADRASAREADPTIQTGVRPRVDELSPTARAAGTPWPPRPRTFPMPKPRGRSTGQSSS